MQALHFSPVIMFILCYFFLPPSLLQYTSLPISLSATTCSITNAHVSCESRISFQTFHSTLSFSLALLPHSPVIQSLQLRTLILQPGLLSPRYDALLTSICTLPTLVCTLPNTLCTLPNPLRVPPLHSETSRESVGLCVLI